MKKFYCAVMFPYPSGSGLHIGHYYNYAIIDSYCRWKRYKGYEVFQPFGYDAFGLPAENYAKSIGGDPKTVTFDNINSFRNQMEKMNTLYEEKLVTCEQSYYKWSQWLFNKLLEHNLAYQKEGIVNWDPIDNTVLANEQVIDGRGERSGALIEQRLMTQWYFKITEYKDRLIKNLDTLDYPKSTIAQQRKWLENLKDWCVSRQRNWGTPIPVEGSTETLDTFVDSSFYYLRYLTNSDTEFLPKTDYKQVDLYIGGNEHACAHLIYARFINMFLYDLGIVEHEEPFKKVIHQGMITKNGNKMSKSKGNSVSPDEYDSDELRFYLMFIGHYFDGGDWNDSHISGIRRFKNRFSLWLNNSVIDGIHLDLNVFFNKIDNYVESFKFNKIVSEYMTFYNANKNIIISTECANILKENIKLFMPNFK